VEVVETLGVEQLGDVLLGPLHHVDLGAAVELASRAGLLRPFALVGDGVVDVGGVLFAVVVDCPWLLLLREGVAHHFALIPYMIIRGELPEVVVLPDPIEVGMLQRIDGRQPIRRVHLQKLLQEVQGLGRQFAQIALVDSVEVLDVGELHAQEPGVLEECLVVVGGERPQTLLDEEELVELVLAREHGVAVDELAQNTTDRPYIYLLGVVGADEQLRRPIPSCRYIVC